MRTLVAAMLIALMPGQAHAHSHPSAKTTSLVAAAWPDPLLRKALQLPQSACNAPSCGTRGDRRSQ